MGTGAEMGIERDICLEASECTYGGGGGRERNGCNEMGVTKWGVTKWALEKWGIVGSREMGSREMGWRGLPLDR